MSELVAALIARGLGSDPVNVSDDDVPNDNEMGTDSVTSCSEG